MPILTTVKATWQKIVSHFPPREGALNEFPGLAMGTHSDIKGTREYHYCQVIKTTSIWED